MMKNDKLVKSVLNSWHLILNKQVIACLSAVFLTTAVYANPVPSGVAAGQVSIQQTPNSTIVNQSSQKAIIDWRSFNIGKQDMTHFQQPAGGVALNRISPTDGPSAIYGKLTATGQIILMNPAGIYFGPSAFVNVGGLIATTATISAQDFLNGRYHFKQDPAFINSSIINQGQIIAAAHGLIALIGNNVQNTGLIQANVGKIVLASGSAYTMNFDGSNLINFTVDGKALGNNRGISNTGALIADGGKILVTAKAAQGVLDNVINMQGVVQARSVGVQNGEIIFSGDNDAGVVKVAANIDVSGSDPGSKGGNVYITGYNILLDSPTKINASGDLGGGNIFIGGNYQGKGPLPNANATVMMPDAVLMADAYTKGNGGNIILWADNVTKAYGTLSARGGAQGGDGGLIETSGHHYLDVAGISVDTRAPNGKMGMWLLDPTDLTINGNPTADVVASGVPTDLFTADNNVDTSTLNVTDLTTALGSSSVTVLTTSGGTGLGSGNITVDSDISWATANTLTLDAFGDIFLNASILGSNGTLTLIANGGSTTVANFPAVIINVANLNINAGTFTPNFSTTFPNTNMAVTIASGATFDSSFQTPITLGSIAGAGDFFGSGFVGLTVGGNNASTVFSGRFLGSINITKEGTGTLTLSGASTTDQQVTINDGTISFGANDSLASIQGITVNSGTILDLNNTDQTFGFIQGAGDILLGSGTLTSNSGALSTFSGDISGTGGLTLNSGVLILSGTGNTYSGTTTVNGGFLRLGVDDAIASSSELAMGAAGTFQLNGFNTSVGSISGSGTIERNSNTLTVGDARDLSSTFTGFISGSGGSLIKEGAGDFDMFGTMGVTSDVTINDGTLRVNNTNAFYPTSNLDIAAAGTFDLNNTNITIGYLQGAGDVLLGSATLTSNSGFLTTFSGDISGTGGLTLNSGVLILSGTGNTYSGTTTVNGGFLRLGADDAIASSSELAVGASGTFQLNSFNTSVGSISGSGTIERNSNTLTVGDARDLSSTFTGLLSGTGGSLIKEGAGDFDMFGAMGVTDNVFINDGTLRVNNTSAFHATSNLDIAAAGTFDLNNTNITIGYLQGAGDVLLGSGTLTSNSGFSTTFSGDISGTGGLTLGSGVLTLDGVAKTYTGATTVNGGILRLGVADAIASSTNLDVGGSGTFQLNTFDTDVGGISGTGTIELGTNTLTVGSSNNTFTFSGNMIGNGSLVKEGTGTFNMFGALSGSGDVSVTAGTMQVSNTTSFNNSNNLSISGGANFNVTNGAVFAGSLSGAGNLSLGSGTFRSNSGSSTTFSGIISGNGSFTKSGAGTLTLSGANTYNGSTVISGGSTLQVDDALGLGSATGGTTVGSGATLILNGINIAGEPITLNNGTINVLGSSSLGGPITLVSSSTDIINADVGNDLVITGNINGAGSLTLQGAGSISVSGNIGNTTSLANFTHSTTGGGFVNSAFVSTSGNQTYDNPIIVSADTTYQAGGDITFNDNLDADSAADITINSTGTTIFGGIVGSSGFLNDLTVTAGGIVSNGTVFLTTGNQTFNGPFTLAFLETFFTLLGSANTNIALNGNILGGNEIIVGGNTGSNTLTVNTGSSQDWVINSGNSGNITGLAGVSSFVFSDIENLTGSSGNDTFTLSGGTLSGSINGNGGTNTLTGDNVANNWIITSSNTGTVTGLGGTFSNIQSLFGGTSSDNFVMNGGTLSGSINGGVGNDSLTANNVANTWTIAGENAGTVTGIGGGFDSIENLTGGNSGNTFTFDNNAVITGGINGGSLAENILNTLNYSNYTSQVNIVLTDTNIGTAFSDAVGTVNAFTNINNLVNNNLGNQLTLPNKSNKLTIDGAKTGSINDPIFFSGFSHFISLSGSDSVIFTVPASVNSSTNTVVINGITMTFFNFTLPTGGESVVNVIPLNVASIIQQPDSGNIYDDILGPGWLMAAATTYDNITHSADSYNRAVTRKVTINPYCGIGG